jgi:ribosomal protein L34E
MMISDDSFSASGTNVRVRYSPSLLEQVWRRSKRVVINVERTLDQSPRCTGRWLDSISRLSVAQVRRLSIR